MMTFDVNDLPVALRGGAPLIPPPADRPGQALAWGPFALQRGQNVWFCAELRLQADVAVLAMRSDDRWFEFPVKTLTADGDRLRLTTRDGGERILIRPLRQRDADRFGLSMRAFREGLATELALHA